MAAYRHSLLPHFRYAAGGTGDVRSIDDVASRTTGIAENGVLDTHNLVEQLTGRRSPQQRGMGLDQAKGGRASGSNPISSGGFLKTGISDIGRRYKHLLTNY